MEMLTRILPKVLSYFVTYYVTSEVDPPILSPAQQTVSLHHGERVERAYLTSVGDWRS